MLQTQPFFRLFPLLVVLFALRPSIAEEPPCHSEPWEKDIAKFEVEDRTNPPPHESNLFVGSSSIRGWRLPKYFPELTTINRGFGGSQICDSTHFLDRLVLKHRPQVVVIYAGDNDMAAGKSAEQVHRDFLAFVAGVHASLPETKIVFIAIKPSIARWKLADSMHQANSLIAAECAKQKKLAFVDIWQPMLGDEGRPRKELFREDGLHLSHEGYTLWSKLLMPHIVDNDDASLQHNK